MKNAQAEMPKYKCHKEVHALKIASITYDYERARKENCETDGSAYFEPTDNRYASFKVDREYLLKHRPEIGGYYVVYEDGYVSFSPAKAFEEGYTKI